MNSPNTPNTGDKAAFLPHDFMDWSAGIHQVNVKFTDRTPDDSQSTSILSADHNRALFTFAPVYQCLCDKGKPLLDFDLVEQFQVDFNRTFDVLVHRLDKPIFSGNTIKYDRDIVQSLPQDEFDLLIPWVQTLGFYTKKGAHANGLFIVYMTKCKGIHYFLPEGAATVASLDQYDSRPPSVRIHNKQTKG